jgi:hypothetical protein
MKYNLFSKFNRREILIFCGFLTLTLGLFLGVGQKPSWAAPEQNPHMQTVPPRPTKTPPAGRPTPTPSIANPPAVPTTTAPLL